MPISDTEKLDLLWKKVGYGVTKTAPSTSKTGSNETIASPLAVYGDNIWTQTGLTSIPAEPPGSDTATIELWQGAGRIRMTNDATAAANLSWLATSTFNNTATRQIDFIPPSFGAGYAIKVYIGDPNGGPAARIFPDTNNEEWVFDYNAGVLHFITAVPGTKTATIGSGNVTVAGNGIYIEAYQYVGAKGVATAGATSKTYVVADITARNALSGLAAGDIVYVTDASGNPADAGAGEYAVYLWNGSAFVLIATQDSARSDSLTSSVNLTPASSGSISLGRIGNGARVVAISVDVTEAFDGSFAFVVGDAGDADRLVDGNDVDLASVGTYVITPTYQFPTNAETELLLAISGTATAGAALVTFTYA